MFIFFRFPRTKITCQCDNCGAIIKMKPYQYNRAKYHYCCKECFNEHKKITFRGENNHQFGLKGPLNPTFKKEIISHKNNRLNERLIYVGDWYKKYTTNGRICLHRYLVEKNYHLYDPSLFEVIDKWHYLKPNIEVHHIDFNHNNNDLKNLIPLTKSEHTSIHNKERNQTRNQKGQFVKL